MDRWIIELASPVTREYVDVLCALTMELKLGNLIFFIASKSVCCEVAVLRLNKFERLIINSPIRVEVF